MITDRMVTLAKGEDGFLLIKIDDGIKTELRLEEHELKHLIELGNYWLSLEPKEKQ